VYTVGPKERVNMGLPDVEELKYLIECPSASAISLKDLETFYDNVLEGEGFFHH
jgi:hypothetical protein